MRRGFPFLAALCVTFRVHAAIDLNNNGLSDVWEQIYGASGVATNLDSDADGVPNYQECIAGTDPFNPSSFPKIPLIYVSGTNVLVAMTNGLGKFYQLQSCTNLGGSWSNESSAVARTDPMSFPVPANLAKKFFRIMISDVDSDGDGLTDWEEYKLGLDPLNANSNGQLDLNGNLIGDYAYATAMLASQNVVNITAPDPTAVQPDPGQTATSLGTFTVSRGGFPLNSITVNLGIGGPGNGFATEGVDHAALPRSVVLPAGASSQDVMLTPLANTNRAAPVVAMLKLLSGTGYTIGTSTNASVVIYPSQTPTGAGLLGQYYTNNSTNYLSVTNFNPTNLMFTRIDPVVDFTWSTSSPFTNNGHFTIRWTGQVEPQYSEPYYFVANTDDGVKLWVNDQLIIDAWTNKSASDVTGTINLQAGTRYDIKLDYYQGTGSAVTHLSWYSPSQSKQVIPSNRLYPTNSFGVGSNAPAAITSAASAVGFVGQPFSFNVTAANSPLGYSATNLPPGLSFNSANGLISGTPSMAGSFQTFVTASNAMGVGASVVNIQIFDTVNAAVTREIWTNVLGTNIADIPVNATANLSGAFGGLEGISNYGTNYAERVRGYITPPTTGNYYFWIAGSDAAELWISNDNESVNKVRRAYTTGPTGSRQWTLQPKQKSPWLALVAGQKYYIEILHKAGTGGNDNWSVGWLFDSTGTNNVPGGLVPSYLLSRYFAPPPAILPGTLYTANMLAQGAISTAVGSATLRVSADGTQAVLKRTFSGLTSAMTGEHIHGDSYNGGPQGIILFDIDQATPQPDGSYVWNIGPVSPLSAADIAEMIREGKTYINIHTVNYPAGEINGHFALAEGSQTFTAPPAPPAWTDDHTNANAAARFLQQATFGPSSNDIVIVQSFGYDGWINNQFALPVSHHLTNVLANVSADPTTPYSGNLTFNAWWLESVTSPDQLRQRVAFALSEIMVVSDTGVLQDNARALSDYYDTLLDNSFGNFRDLLKAVTLTPAMGLYLDMRRNDKGDISAGTHANENYAREVNQLFSIGLNRLWPDGTLILNSQANLVPTYDQNVINGFAAVFTGWNYYQTNQANGRLPSNWSPSADYIDPMVLVPTHHDLNTKRLLDNVVLPAAYGSQADSTSTNFDIYCSQDLESALDAIFYNQNVGPFICRQLIQRLVTSNPSRDYLYRVVQKFNDNGYGVRGDMQAVLKAILLDYEARSSAKLTLSTYGKQREPLLRVTAIARAFPAPPTMTGTYSQNGNQNIAITTSVPHRLNNNDDVFLYCTDTSSQPVPPSQAYNNVIVTNSSVFNVQAPGVFAANYTQSGSTITIITNSSHGLSVGQPIYLVFTSAGSPTNGIYPVTTVLSNTAFQVTASDTVTRSGFCLFPKLTGGGYVTSQGTNTTVATTLAHGLNVGDSVYLNFTAAGSPPDGTYPIVAVPDATHFSVITPAGSNGSQNSLTTLPQVPPILSRSGNVTIQFSTWAMNATDTGTSSSLSQTPLNSPTVFNFFFPDYKFPGTLAAAALTTPEFQLTSDSSVALQMNFLEGGILTSTGNTNGLGSFNGGNGAIMLDLGPWMTTNYTSQTGVSNMVVSLSSLLCAGQLSANARSNIVSYVTNTTNFGYSSPPTATQMRDRVRAAVHLIVSSPDFTIQK